MNRFSNTLIDSQYTYERGDAFFNVYIYTIRKSTTLCYLYLLIYFKGIIINVTNTEFFLFIPQISLEFYKSMH
jgi:hypothetical protein